MHRAHAQKKRERLPHLFGIDDKHVANERAAQFLVAFRAFAQQQYAQSCGDHVHDAYQGFLRDMVVALIAGQRENNGDYKGKSKRHRVGLGGIRLILQQKGHASAERRHLRQRKVHEDDFSAYNVQPQIYENSR